MASLMFFITYPFLVLGYIFGYCLNMFMAGFQGSVMQITEHLKKHSSE